MKIKEVLQRDPAAYPLVNQGQARITDKTNQKEIDELKGELFTFVCEGQFADGLQRILSSYLTNLSQTSQKGSWVSGFFGSGKTQFEKMLGNLWQDTQFADGSTARSLVPAIPEELRNLLRELDTAGKRAGGLLAASGSLPSGTTDNVRLTVLGILLRAVGLPDQYAQAQFCLWLHDQGYFDRVKETVERAGKDWNSELNNLYVSGPIARAVQSCDPKFAANEVEARKVIRDTFPTRNSDISTPEFLATFKRALKLKGRDGRLPCTVLILDEAQQYIGDSNDRSMLLTEVAEAVSKSLDSHVMVVAAGQSALTDVPKLHKLMDRFTIRVPLSDSDVETVTRKVLLQKKPAALSAVKEVLATHSGEVSRELQGTRIGERTEDREILVDDYPLLPVRRRFWESCFRQIDAEGTHSQLRSQLRIIHDAVRKLSDKELGAVVPGDELYEALAPEMVNTGVLLREINERIINLSKGGKPEALLARRVCGVVFLIGKLSREVGADIGVRATKDHVADLLIDDLRGDNGKLRNAVEISLEQLVSDGVLMKVGDEYRLQTKEGSEWDREFRNRQTKLANDDADLSIRRDGLLYAEAERIIKTVKILQGTAKEARPLAIYRDQNPPSVTGENVPVWIRDQWSATRKEVEDEARKAGNDGPIVYVFIPRQAAEDLKKLIVEAEAANQTIQLKGNVTSPEGQEARQSMLSRRDVAVQRRGELVQQIVGNTQVFQGGGNEVLSLTLEEKVRQAANDSLVRLFPRFKEADAAGSAWESAIKRARDGADNPFQPVGYTNSIEQHAVCQQVLSTVGSGKSGSEVRKTLRGSPFGWPQDAIDAALIALHRSQHITAVLNGVPVSLGQLDQNKISKSEFRVEKATLSVSDRLILRKLFSSLIPIKTGEEAAKAPEFLGELLKLAGEAGGEPPLPARPIVKTIEDLRNLFGTEQLLAIKDKATEIEKNIEEWKRAKTQVEQRLPIWRLTENLARHAAELTSASESINQLNATRNERLLLQTTDPVAPLRGTLAGLLRKAVNDANVSHEQAYKAAMARLKANDTWAQVPLSEQEKILAEVGLRTPTKVDVSSDESLLSCLDNRPLGAMKAEVDAITGRAERALELAAKFLEPKIRVVSLERATLRTDQDVRQWLSRQEKTLLEAVTQGPVLVN